MSEPDAQTEFEVVEIPPHAEPDGYVEGHYEFKDKLPPGVKDRKVNLFYDFCLLHRGGRLFAVPHDIAMAENW